MNETQRQLLITTIVLGVLAIGGAAYYYYGFAKEDIEKTNKEIEKLQKEIDEINAERKKYQDFLKIRNQVDQLVRTITDATTRLPTDKNDRRYVEKMRDFIAKTGVEMNALEKQKQQGYKDWIEFPHLISGNTRYSDFVQFLSLSEQNSDYFMRVKEFDIKNDNKSNNPTVHPFTLVLSSFVFKD